VAPASRQSCSVPLVRLRRRPDSVSARRSRLLLQSSIQGVCRFLSKRGVPATNEELEILWGKRVPECQQQCVSVYNLITSMQTNFLFEVENSTELMKNAIKEYVESFCLSMMSSLASLSLCLFGDNTLFISYLSKRQRKSVGTSSRVV